MIRNFYNKLNTIEKIYKKIVTQDLTQKYVINIDSMFIIKFWLIAIIVFYVSYLLFQSLNLVYLIVAAFIISIAMESVISFFQGFKFLNRGLSILISYILLFLFVISAFVVVIPFVASQSVEILKHLVDKFQTFQHTLEAKGLEYIINNSDLIPNYFKGIFLSLVGDKQTLLLIQNALQQNISQIVGWASNYIGNIGTLVVNIIAGFFSAMFQVIFVFIMAIFFSLEKDKVINFLTNLLGGDYIFKKKIDKLYSKLGYRLKGQLFLSLYVAISVIIGLYILKFLGIDLPSKFTLALIAALTEIIPILGPILGGIPAILVAAVNEGFWGIVAVIIMYGLIQFLENNILIPIVMNQALGVSPLVIFIAMVFGGASFGFVGVILAVPLAVIISLVFENFLERQDINSGKIKSNDYNDNIK